VTLTVKQLSSCWHIRGRGLCNWAQPPHWPCDEQTLRDSCFSEASPEFIAELMRAAEEEYSAIAAAADAARRVP
jgi:hypothetical protein